MVFSLHMMKIFQSVDQYKQVIEELAIENFKASNDWIDKFKAQYNMLFEVVCGKSKSVNTKTVDEWRIQN